MGRKNAGQRRIHLCACGEGRCFPLCGAQVFFASLSCEDAVGIVCKKCQGHLVRLVARQDTPPDAAPLDLDGVLLDDAQRIADGRPE